MSPTRRLVLLPGLATDARLFARLDVPGWDLAVPPWLLNEHREPIERYADRVAEHVRRFEPDALGGHSMGGIVALEVASRLGLREVCLMSCVRRPEELPPLEFRHLRRMLGVVSDWVVRPVVRVVPAQVLKITDLDAETRRLVAEMFHATPLGFTRWAIWAMAHWRGETPGNGPAEQPDLHVHHIQGEQDRLLPPKRTTPDRVVDGAGHLLPLTHAQEVSSWLAEVLSGVGLKAGVGTEREAGDEAVSARRAG